MNHFKTVLLAISIGLLGASAWAADEAGVVKISKGTVVVERGSARLDATVGTRIYASDRVVTGANGAVGITLRDNTLLSAGPNSTVDLNAFSFDATTHAGAIDASVKRGTLSVISGKISKASPDTVRFSAPGMTLGVRGTRFLIDAGS